MKTKTSESSQPAERHDTVSADARDFRVRALMLELAEWCEAERGRQMVIARMFGVTRSAVSDWINHRGVPSLAKGLALKEFLDEQRRDRQ